MAGPIGWMSFWETLIITYKGKITLGAEMKSDKIYTSNPTQCLLAKPYPLLSVFLPILGSWPLTPQ
jgi:hypothetical protein